MMFLNEMKLQMRTWKGVNKLEIFGEYQAKRTPKCDEARGKKDIARHRRIEIRVRGEGLKPSQ